MTEAGVIPGLTSPFGLHVPHSVMTVLRSANFSEQHVLMVYRLTDLCLMLAESAEWQNGRQWRELNSASRANTLNVG